MTDATHTITAKVTDASGAQSAAAAAFNVTVDTIAPTVAITGVVVDTTNLPNVTVNGTVGLADAGRTVSVYAGATLIGTTTAGEDGSWSLAGVTLAEGANNLSAQVTDAAGNVGTSTSFAAPTVVSTGTTTVTAATVTDMGYIVLGSGTLDIVAGGNVSAQITVGNGGVVYVLDGATALDTLLIVGGTVFDYRHSQRFDGRPGRCPARVPRRQCHRHDRDGRRLPGRLPCDRDDSHLSGQQQVLEGGLDVHTALPTAATNMLSGGRRRRRGHQCRRLSVYRCRRNRD